MDKEKKFGLFIKGKDQMKDKKVRTFVDDLDEDDEDQDLKYDPQNIKNEINKSIQRQQQYNALKMSEEMSNNLLQDPNFYEYDSLYEDVSYNNTSKRNSTVKESEKPKYIGAILAATEKRKLEQAILKEKVERKKRERELGQEFADKPKYITKAYEEKMAQNKSIEKNMSLIDKYEEKNTVNSEMGMMGFYSNLLTKNVAYGGGRRGEGSEDVVRVFQEKKKQYEEFIGEKEQLYKEKIKEKVQENKKINQEINVTTTSIDNTSEKEKVGLEDYKKRYLERKRNRTENEDKIEPIENN